MPRKGDYSLHIIEATTEQTFKEHVGSDEIDAFVEVEPGLEYYVKIDNHSETNIIIVHCEVDGEELEYSSTIGPGENSIQGIWNYDKESQRSQSKALKFNKLVSRSIFHQGCNESNDNEDTEVGIIKITIYEKIVQDGYHYVDQLESNFGHGEDNDITLNESNIQDGTNKLLCSQEGTNEDGIEEDDGKRRNYIYGEHLEVIKIKYCTALGLIVEGVLPKPPLWELHKMAYPQNTCDARIAAIEPISLKKETRDMNGNVVESKCFDMFDLTEMTCDSEADDDADMGYYDDDELSRKIPIVVPIN